MKQSHRSNFSSDEEESMAIADYSMEIKPKDEQKPKGVKAAKNTDTEEDSDDPEKI